MAGAHIQHVSEYSPDGKLYAFINADGKLQIWDTEANQLKQEYVPNLHLSAPCTCLTWIQTKTAAPQTNGQSKKKSRKSLDHGETALYIALGTNKGGISLYSYATGKIESQLKGDGHAGRAVTAICRGAADTLYTTGEDCRLVTWSLTAGAQSAVSKIGADLPTCVAYLPQSGRLLVGTRELTLWSPGTDASAAQCQQTFTGHSSNVCILKSLLVGDTEYVLSTSKMDRTVSMWRCTAADQTAAAAVSAVGRNAVATFLMADVAHYVSTAVTGDRLEVSAVTRSGVAHVFIVKDVNEINSAKPIKPKVTIEVASDHSDIVAPIPLLAASIEHSVSQQSLLVAYGSRALLQFEHIEYTLAEKNQVLIRKDPTKVLSNSNLTRQAASASAKDRALKTVTPVVDGTAEYQTASTVVARKTKPIEMPMETRLENLSLDQSQQATKNVAQLLVQGLHNHDQTILRNVFATTEEKVVRSTLQRLPPQYVASLVTELTSLTQQKTLNAEKSVMWLKQVLHTHASQLMALGSNTLFAQFGPLLGIIEHRTNSLQQLSKLSGRMDLLVSQIKRNTDDDDEDQLNSKNLLVFEDADSLNGSDLEDGLTDDDDEQFEEESEELDSDDAEMDVDE